ncbi:hypothetical protein [Nocardia otitidiscaviarum]|uniref:hypothetical protein n=1 Tax=Nocardia otitidiscaviarum TaxID=1823 RepID=UPI0006940387|nr:hypothetical protein [Nocardia otitidiscaviarum]
MTAATRPTVAHRPHPDTWEPDPLLAVAARTGGVRLLDLTVDEQCWLVAHLTAAGLTAEEIADRCRCGRRKVMYVRANPLTVAISRWLIAEAQAAAHAHRADALDRWCHATITECEQNGLRVRGQLAAAVDQITALRTRCRSYEQRARTYLKYLQAPTTPRRRTAPHPDQLVLF